MTEDFPPKTMEAKKRWDVFQVQKETVSLESHTQERYASGMKGKSQHSQMNEK